MTDAISRSNTRNPNVELVGQVSTMGSNEYSVGSRPKGEETLIIRVSYARIATLVACLAYPILLLWVLRELIAPDFAYMGYVFQPPDNRMLLVSALLLAVLPSVNLSISAGKPSNVVLWFLYLLVYVPGQIIPIFTIYSTDRSWIGLQLSLFSGICILMVVSSIPSIRIVHLAVHPNVFWAAIFALSILAYAVIFSAYGLPSRLPGLLEVYDVRSDYRSEVAKNSVLVPYLLNWQAKVLNPLLICHGVSKRKPLTLMLGIIGQVLLYASTGSKTVLFSGLLVVAILVALRRRGIAFGLLIAIGTTSLVALSALFDKLIDSILFTSLFVRRLIVTPGLLTGFYFDFFSVNQQVKLSNSFLSSIFHYPYDRSVPLLIGLEFFRSPNLSANANFWADGFANFGYFGIILFSFVLGFVLWWFNSLALDRDFRTTAVLAGMSAFSLTNSALFTSLLTHGIALSIIVLFLQPSEKLVDS